MRVEDTDTGTEGGTLTMRVKSQQNGTDDGGRTEHVAETCNDSRWGDRDNCAYGGTEAGVLWLEGSVNLKCFHARPLQ